MQRWIYEFLYRFDKSLPTDEVWGCFGETFTTESSDEKREVALPGQISFYVIERNTEKTK